MKTYGTCRSTIQPLELEITEASVFVASDITPVTELETQEDPGFVGFEYTLVEYTKNEYIKLQAEKNQDLESMLVDTQLALCDIYEMMGG